VPERLIGTGDPIIFADVFFEPPNRELSLFLGKPRRGSREIWQNKEGREGNNNSDGSFNDEPCLNISREMQYRVSICSHPSPSPESSGQIETICDASSNQSREGPGY
jgi:hypothetical protein